MANKKITELPVAGTITGTEELAVVQDGVTRRSTVSGILSNNVLTSPTAISNSSTPALTITQTGSGDCLVINDETGDTSRFVVTAAGNVGIGGTGADHKLTVASGDASFAQTAGTKIAFNANDAFTSTGAVNTARYGITYNPQNGFDVGLSGSGGVYFYTSDVQRMHISNVGNVGVAADAVTTSKLRIGGNISGGANAQALRLDSTVQSDVTGAGRGAITVLSTAAASFSTSLTHFQANQGTIGAGSTVNAQYGFTAEASLIGATNNNYGFYGAIPAGTGRYNFYAAGTAPNYFAGDISTSGNISGNQATAAKVAFNVSDAFTSSGGVNTARYGMTFNAMGETFNVGLSGWGGLGFYTTDVLRMKIGSSGGIGIGGDPHSASSLRINGSITGGTDANGILIDGTITNTTTGVGRGILSVIGTAPDTFSTNLVHFNASQGNLGAGSTVGTQYGFVASGSMIGATTNIGFYGAIPAGTGRFNFYASGTAENYFEGKTTINSTLQVNASVVEKVFTVTDGDSVDLNPTNGTIQQWTLGASRTPTATAFANGQSMTLMIADGTAYAVTWPSVTWVGGSAPTLATTGWTIVELFKISNVLYGASVGGVA